MKKPAVLLAAGLLSSSLFASDTRSTGEVDLIITPIGDTSAGVRYTFSPDIQLSLVVDSFDKEDNDRKSYNATTDSQEPVRVEGELTIDVQAAIQYFFSAELYALAELGYYRYSTYEDFDDDSLTDETYLWSGFDGAIGMGLEHPLTDKLSLFSNAKIEIGERKGATEYTLSSTTTPGNENNRSFASTSFSLGLSYNLF
ncbi:hypothetical protein [Reinekea sp. G2M2-21]|uniref:hypothetical protein n=1 Tax=Reinekea sp. G2M2-21 TaxID=2788942 RepID=UPI0018A9221E|nr:hypothetical protein [Reinekea sp. G2M2-21]